MAETVKQLTEELVREVGKIIIGKEAQIRLIVMALLAEGHVLLDDMPGVGKTTMVKTLSLALGCGFKRIQFVPDLLPSDITGMSVYNQKTGDFQRMDGPVMTNLLLADEINRAIPRTQSALLEAMEEKQVTIDGETVPLPKPFIVMATQNPVESESTFQLPAAQMDRFLVRLSLGYPDRREEAMMLEHLGGEMPFDQVRTVTNAQEIAEFSCRIRQVYLSGVLGEYIVEIVQATRSHPLLRMGASPRASRGLYKAGKAWAAMNGRDFVTPDDLQALMIPVLAHRLLLTSEARLSGKTAETIVEEIVSKIPVPPAGEAQFGGR